MGIDFPLILERSIEESGLFTTPPTYEPVEVMTQERHSLLSDAGDCLPTFPDHQCIVACVVAFLNQVRMSSMVSVRAAIVQGGEAGAQLLDGFRLHIEEEDLLASVAFGEGFTQR